MTRYAFSNFVIGAILTITTLTGCEAVGSAGQLFNKWVEQNVATSDAPNKKPTTNQERVLAATSDPNCPEVKILSELAQISQFSTPKSPDATQQIAKAQFDNVSAICQKSTNSVTLEISLDFTGNLGPIGLKDMNGQANYTYPYFLSVITPSGKILSKDVFALSMSYDKGNIIIHKQDRLRQTIPLMAGQDPHKYQIIAGFQLNEEELNYNRSVAKPLDATQK